MSASQKIISPTLSTPEVILDPSGTIKFTGRLISENPVDFFCAIDEWLKDYSSGLAPLTKVEIYLEFINSVGSKFLLDLIHEITQIFLRNSSKKFIINWYFEDLDEDMLEKGKIFSSISKVTFNFIKKV